MVWRDVEFNAAEEEINRFSFEFMASPLSLLCLYYFFILPELLTKPAITVTLIGFLAVTITRFFIFRKWAKTIQQWLKAYHSLTSWEEKVITGSSNIEGGNPGSLGDLD